MRTVLVMVLVLGSAAAASAQRASAPTTTSIGLPLPPIGLPLPSIGLPPPDAAPAPPPRRPGGRPHRPHATPIVFFGAPYDWGLDPWQRSAAPGEIASPPLEPMPEPPRANVDSVREFGTLQLEVKPRDAQLYVDGEFVGTWSDVAGQLELAPGTHRIEIRAPNHEAHTFDARITAGHTITYRSELTRLPDRPAPARKPLSSTPSDKSGPPERATRAASQTFYLIPGCYLGNIPPDQVKLPAGCDLTRMITHTPHQE